MRNTLSLIALLLALQACNKDSYFTLTPTNDIVQFIPNNTTEKRYRSNTDDTLSFLQAGIDTNYIKSSQDIGSTGNVGTLDYVEVREHTATLRGVNNPYKVNYRVYSQYDPSLGSRSRDFLDITFFEDNVEQGKLSFIYTDSLICVSERCGFETTLKLQEKSFSNVYFLKRDSISRQSFYINATKGFVGFRTTDNKIFELID
ncbi:hypothetical protein [Owenweeksia hongkongensis]|uniref:Lipoprotein n=1 Tax=Owenweeksia hongkongensis (strain DSM 17368 / CIP 108786 / JCM 12287 / NRRL B-23963 / UST20020801) TaxID=926562 RepID=G8R7B8_OWEHD|nr:hypothetical protein [Owenweeksia hongkongensis]AEV31229.1 hypothetical protein Oweho_0207 [Owenweeksia hongkongensis DSM 17368]